MSEVPTQLFAFWKYHDGSQHTFLGSPVKTMHPDGRITTEGYGGSVTVKPAALLPLNSGVERLRKIEEIDRELATKIVKLKNEACAQRLAVLGLEANP